MPPLPSKQNTGRKTHTWMWRAHNFAWGETNYIFSPRVKDLKLHLSVINLKSWSKKLGPKILPNSSLFQNRGEKIGYHSGHMHAQNAKLCTSQNICQRCAQISMEKMRIQWRESLLCGRSMHSVYFCLCTVNTLCAYLCACMHPPLFARTSTRPIFWPIQA